MQPTPTEQTEMKIRLLSMKEGLSWKDAEKLYNKLKEKQKVLEDYK